jgi:hypothetical protein
LPHVYKRTQTKSPTHFYSLTSVFYFSIVGFNEQSSRLKIKITT